MTYHQLCIKQSCAAIGTGPKREGRDGMERQAWHFYIGEALAYFLQHYTAHVYANTAEEEKVPPSPYKYGCRCDLNQLNSAAVCEISFLCKWHYIKELFSVQAALWMHSLLDHNQMKWVTDNMQDQTENLASAHSSKSAKIPADAKATISMATGYCSIRSKSNSWRLL